MIPTIPTPQALNRKRAVEIYFTCTAHAQPAGFSLVLSSLPPLQTLTQTLPSQAFAARFLAFFFGPHSGLTFDQLSAAGLAYESLPYEGISLCTLHASAEQLEKLKRLDFESHDFWCVALAEKPTPQALRALGIVPNASALHHPGASLGRAVLVNYFTDPSFHGHDPRDLHFLLQALLDRAFEEAFPGLEERGKVLRAALDLEKHLGLAAPAVLTNAQDTPYMQSFVLRPGTAPRLEQMQWTTQRRSALEWEGNAWSGPVGLEPGSLARGWEMARPYLTPLLLVPIAIVVIPVTLALWPLVAAVRWSVRKRQV